jgi:hypothetical protein
MRPRRPGRRPSRLAALAPQGDGQRLSLLAAPMRLCLRPRTNKRLGRANKGRRSAERRMPTMCRASQTSVCGLRHSSAARLRAIVGGAPAFRRFDRGSRRDSHPDSAPGHASWIENQAGVTRSIASQCSGSTPRLGRNTEGNDARSRSGAGCEPARKHRTRSTLRIASGMRPW